MTPVKAPARQSEIESVVADYVETRRRIDAGELWWTDLARFFTDDVVFIDPAWGRVEGIETVREFFNESMLGLEDWKFPVECVGIAGDTVLVKWTQISPGAKPDGTQFVQSGCSTLIYAGDGKFCYEEDILNMVHVLEDLKNSRWRPGPGFNSPPANPNRDWSRPRD